jgi:hypothetical protein
MPVPLVSLREDRARWIVPLRGGKRGNELAGGEVIEGAETAAQFGGVQSPLAKEPAEKLLSGALLLLGVAIVTARDEVAVGIAAGLRARHNVVNAPPFTGDWEPREQTGRFLIFI